MAKEETDILKAIRIALEPYAETFRANVGTFYNRARKPVSVGLPKGFPDLFGYIRETNQIFFIEVKTTEGTLQKEQVAFLKQASDRGVICGVARSPEEAIEIVTEGKRYEPTTSPTRTN